MSLNVLLNTGLTVGLSVSEALFLSHPGLGPGLLPQMFIATAVTTIIVTFAYASFVDKLRNDDYYRVILLVALAALGAILTGIWLNLTVAFVAFYGFYYVCQGIFNTHFWNYAADYFDTMEAKRLFPFFPIGNSIGGTAGGLLASVAINFLPPVALGIIWMVVIAIAWFLIKAVSPSLKGWVVMEVQETDESSLDNLKQGFSFLRRSSLGKWHLMYSALMIACLFMLQYLYSDILTKAYPSPEALTGFIGTFLAATNVLEVVIELAFTNRLISLLGVGASNMFYPLTTLLGFVFIGFAHGTPYAVWSAIYSRMNRETFENAISGSCRNLLYNAYPTRFRGRIRAFLEGVVTNVGIVVAGIGIILLANTLPESRLMSFITGLGVAFCLAFLAVAAVVRSKYLESLVKGLKEYHLDLDDVSLEVDRVRDEDIFEMLEELETSEDPASMELVRKMFLILKRRRKIEPVIERLSHPNHYVQEVALDVLADTHDMRLMPHLTRIMKTGTGRLRARALEVIRVFSPLSEVLPYLEDPEPTVRATSASLVVRSNDQRHVERAWKVLEEMLTQTGPGGTQMRTAALWVLPLLGERGGELLIANIHDENPRVRLVALDRLETSDLGRLPTLPFRVATLLDDPTDAVRRSIVRLVSQSDDDRVVPMLARRLADESYSVRELAIKGLVKWGPRCLREVQPYLAARSSTSIDAAIAVLASIDQPEVRESILKFVRDLVDQAHENIVSLAVMEDATEAGDDNLAMLAMRDYLARVRHHVFHAFEFIEDPNVIRNIRRCLETYHRQARGDALEALSNMGDRQLMQGFVALFDDSPMGERLTDSLKWLGQDAPPPWPDVVKRSLKHRDRWIRAGTLYTARLRGWDSGGVPLEETEEFAAMKNLLFLKKVPLFSQMSLEQLEIISRIVNEVTYYKGEVIFKEGEIGDELYVIVEGKVNIVKNYRQPHELVLATLKETDHFGEMAVLDNEGRSATVTIAEDARLLSISGSKLRDIVYQKPEIAFEIFKVLSSRLRKADQRLGDLSREMGALKKQVEANPPKEPTPAR